MVQENKNLPKHLRSNFSEQLQIIRQKTMASQKSKKNNVADINNNSKNPSANISRYSGKSKKSVK
jgi:hypothetical protein